MPENLCWKCDSVSNIVSPYLGEGIDYKARAKRPEPLDRRNKVKR